MRLSSQTSSKKKIRQARVGPGLATPLLVNQLSLVFHNGVATAAKSTVELVNLSAKTQEKEFSTETKYTHAV